MWDVSDRYLAALKRSHRIKTVLTATVPGGSAETLRLRSGRVSCDVSTAIRRKATLELLGDSSVYERVAAPGTLFQISHGLRFGTSEELVPVFTGELVGDVEQEIGANEIGVNLADHSNWLARAKFVKPLKVAASVKRVDAIASVVTTAKPGTTVLNLSSDVETLGSMQVWDSGPLDVIKDLTRDGNTEGFFRPDGVYVIRDLQTIASTAVWDIVAGNGGTLRSAARRRPHDRLYNTVVVRPSASDGKQKWKQQVAQISDLSHPRHPSKIGVVPLVVPSATARSAAAAMGIAVAQLDRVQGTTEMLALASISNAALEGGDVVRVVTPRVNLDAARIFQHFIDGFTLDLSSGGMTAGTRSQVVTDD